MTTRGRPVPDGHTAYLFHAACPDCGAALRLSVDCSCGPPGEVGAECESCGAQPCWRVDWCYAVEVTEYLRDDRRQPTRQRGDKHWKRRTPERIQRGEDCPAAKLTNAQVSEIRQVWEDSNPKPKQAHLARKYRVSRATINGIVRGKRRKGV